MVVKNITLSIVIEEICFKNKRRERPIYPKR